MRLRLVAVQLRSLGGAPVATLLHLRRGLVHLRWLTAEFGALFICCRSLIPLATIEHSKTRGSHLKMILTFAWPACAELG